MAAKPPKPPDHSPIAKVLNSSASDIDEDQSRCQQQQRKSDCSCTNISIMQLFHEMKQEFPTVPDHVVHQCVIDNCHDRENCIDCLNKELAAHPNTAQAYPSHVLRQSQNLICKKPLVPTRPAPVPTPKKPPRNCDSSPRQVIQNQRSIVQSPPREILLKQRNIENISPAGYPAATTAPGTAAALPPTGAATTETGATARSPSSDMRPQFSNCDNSRPSVPPQRPTTLNFREPQTPAFAVSSSQHHLIQQQKTQHHQQSPQNQRVQHRPVRAAPPPPVSSVRHSPLPPAAPNVQNFRSTSIQSPASFSDSGESEISVNISLSPSSSDRSKGPPTRHVSSISVQPEPPYTRDFTPQSPRSFTSLNLTLRKPSATPQSPIDITAGPGLTYSSSSFDARRGYQKSFHITVTDGGGTISASRIRPKSCYNMPAEHQESDLPVVPVSVSVPMPATLPTESSNVLRTGTSMPNVAQDAVARQDPNLALQVDDEIVVRQRYIKQKLLSALETDRKRLRRMQREINVLISSSPPESSTRLDNEILNLRCDCEKMVQEIERAGEMEDDADFYQCIYTGQRLPTQQMQGALGPPPRLPPATATRLAPPIPIQHEQMLQQQHQFHLQNQIHQQQQHQYQQHQQQLQQRQHQQLQMHQQRLHQTETGALGAGGTRAAGPASAPAAYQLNVDDEDDINEEPWTCDLCTFQNHPLLNKCEQCEMIRIAPGTIKIVSASYTPPAIPNNSFNNQSFSNKSNNSCNNVNSNASSSNSHSSLPNNNRVANNHSINRQSSDNNPSNNSFNGLNNLSNASVNPPLVNLFMPDSVI